MYTRAITRKPDTNLAQGLTTSTLGLPSYELALKQHEAYVETLKLLGLTVIELDALPEFPDAHFVEDLAVVTPEVAIIANPGAETRKGEEDSVESVLIHHRRAVRIQPPGTLEGGDVLMIGTHFFISTSERTNMNGAEQLGSIIEKYGYTRTVIHIESGLHLKSSVNYVGYNTLLMTEQFAHCNELKRFDRIIVEKGEEYAANTLLINDRLITPKGFLKTKNKLKALGCEIIELDMSEMQKMDGGLTCLSIRF